MSNIRRLFVEKKDAFAVEAHGLLADLRNNLGMSNLTGMSIVNRYDVMGLSDKYRHIGEHFSVLTKNNSENRP